MSPTSRRRASSAEFDAAARAARRGVLAGAADAGAAEGAPTARSPSSPPPVSTRIALRVPDHPVAQEILTAFGRPVVAPSANRSGHVSPTTAAHVLADLRGRIDLIVDGGPTPVGLESTIVACLGEPALLRPGALPRAEIERVLGRPLAAAAAGRASDAPPAPGQLASHYAPRARLRLDAPTSTPARRCWRSGRRRRPAPDAPHACSTSRRAANWSRPPPTCSPICARSTRPARGHRRHADPA